MYIAEEDGITHINIYSAGKTFLGRSLSNFAYRPISIDGFNFNSIEAYWYYLHIKDTISKADFLELSSLSGLKAKDRGKLLLKEYPILLSSESEEFKSYILKAMKTKLLQHRDIMEALKNSELPFQHYYVFKGIQKDAGYKWILEYWEKLRTIAKEKNL